MRKTFYVCDRCKISSDDCTNAFHGIASNEVFSGRDRTLDDAWDNVDLCESCYRSLKRWWEAE